MINQQMHIDKHVRSHSIIHQHVSVRYVTIIRCLITKYNQYTYNYTNMHNKTTWCYTWFSLALLMVIKCQFILSLKNSKIKLFILLFLFTGYIYIYMVDSHPVRYIMLCTAEILPNEVWNNNTYQTKKQHKPYFTVFNNNRIWHIMTIMES